MSKRNWLETTPIPSTVRFLVPTVTRVSAIDKRRRAITAFDPSPNFFAVVLHIGDDTVFFEWHQAMIFRRITVYFREQEWIALGLEFAIVVVGVFFGLQVDNWNQDRLDSQREALYLSALWDDFDVIIAELEGDIEEYEEIANSMTLLINESRKATPDASLDELNEAARQLIRMEGTPINSGTYRNLTGSGDLAIIKSHAIKNQMSSFFGWVQVVELVADTHEMQLVGIFQPYIIENLDYTTMFLEQREYPSSTATASDRILRVLSTAEFRNIAAVKWDSTTDIRSQLLNALEEARRVESLIAEEIR